MTNFVTFNLESMTHDMGELEYQSGQVYYTILCLLKEMDTCYWTNKKEIEIQINFEHGVQITWGICQDPGISSLEAEKICKIGIVKHFDKHPMTQIL